VVSYFEGRNKSTKIFGPRRDEVTEKFVLLHNKEPCDIYRSAGVVGADVAQ
jgi:hypothetical protein